jgi:hypothetical protein
MVLVSVELGSARLLDCEDDGRGHFSRVDVTEVTNVHGERSSLSCCCCCWWWWWLGGEAAAARLEREKKKMRLKKIEKKKLCALCYFESAPGESHFWSQKLTTNLASLFVNLASKTRISHQFFNEFFEFFEFFNEISTSTTNSLFDTTPQLVLHHSTTQPPTSLLRGGR